MHYLYPRDYLYFHDSSIIQLFSIARPLLFHDFTMGIATGIAHAKSSTSSRLDPFVAVSAFNSGNCLDIFCTGLNFSKRNVNFRN